MARKMAILYFHMRTKKEAFNPEIVRLNQTKFKEKRSKRLEQQLAALKKAA
ncbi:MAG: hypothetical protein AAGC64_02465 [Bacteroidota bacterium]